MTAAVLATYLNHLGSANASEQARAKEKLIQMGHGAVAELTSLINSGHTRQVANAVLVLGAIAHPDSQEILIQCLQHPKAVVRMNSAAALRHFPTNTVRHALVHRLMTDKEIVQMSILGTLQLIGTQNLLDELIELLHRTPSSTLRYLIIRVLGDTEDMHAVPHLERYLEDADFHVRQNARLALNKLQT